MSNNRYSKIFLISLLAFIVSFVIVEFLVRKIGLTPTLRMNYLTWSINRKKIDNMAGNKQVAILLGTSRTGANYDQKLLGERLNVEVIQLGLAGTYHPFVFLKDIAENTDFCGKVFVEVVPLFGNPVYDYRAERAIRYYKNSLCTSEILNNKIETYIFERSVLLSPRIDITRLEKCIFGGFIMAEFDRYTITKESRIYYNYYKYNITTPTHSREFYNSIDVLDNDQWLEYMAKVDSYGKMIIQRGGEVYFVRFPTSGLSKEFEDKTYPREKYWDIFAANTSGVAIHYADFDSDIKCPEDWHLDWRQASVFTGELVDAIKSRKELVFDTDHDLIPNAQ